MLYKCRLNFIGTISRSQAFNRGYFLAGRIDRENQTRIGGLAIESHGAGTAGADIADKFWTGNGRLKVVAQRA